MCFLFPYSQWTELETVTFKCQEWNDLISCSGNSVTIEHWYKGVVISTGRGASAWWGGFFRVDLRGGQRGDFLTHSMTIKIFPSPHNFSSSPPVINNDLTSLKNSEQLVQNPFGYRCIKLYKCNEIKFIFFVIIPYVKGFNKNGFW